jgi:hypothetical protein
MHAEPFAVWLGQLDLHLLAQGRRRITIGVDWLAYLCGRPLRSYRIVPWLTPNRSANVGTVPYGRVPWRVGPCFGESESFRPFLQSLITAASRINTFAGHGRLDVAGDSDSVPRRHGDAQGVAVTIATAGAAELALKVEHLGVRRSVVLQQRGGDVSPPSAGRTARDDHMPWAQIVQPQGVAGRNVPCLFHLARATPERARKQG